MKLFLAALLSLPFLLACGSSPVKTHYYQLPHVEPVHTAAESSVQKQLVQLKSLQLAPFLNQQGIAFQQSSTELTLANTHLWADNLASQLQRHLRHSMHNQSTKWSLVSSGNVAPVQLSIQLDRFVGTADGFALLSGEYHIQSNTTQVTGPFLIRHPLSEDGYPALVEALALGWQQLAAILVQQLEQFE